MALLMLKQPKCMEMQSYLTAPETKGKNVLQTFIVDKLQYCN